MFNLRLPTRLRPYYDVELYAARTATARRDWPTAFAHLERAHVLGQRWALPHTHTHLLMLRHGWRSGDRREILGQVVRLGGGFCCHSLGEFPLATRAAPMCRPSNPCPFLLICRLY